MPTLHTQLAPSRRRGHQERGREPVSELLLSLLVDLPDVHEQVAELVREAESSAVV